MTFWERERTWAHSRPAIVERECFPRWVRGELCEHEERVKLVYRCLTCLRDLAEQDVNDAIDFCHDGCRTKGDHACEVVPLGVAPLVADRG